VDYVLWTVIIVQMAVMCMDSRGMCGMCLMYSPVSDWCHRAQSWSDDMLFPWFISNPDQEIKAAILVRVIFGAWVFGEECLSFIAWVMGLLVMGLSVPDGICILNCFRIKWKFSAATTVRSQLCDQCQYLVGILLCLSYGIVIVWQIHGRRYSVHHNTVQKLAVNCLCGQKTVCCLWQSWRRHVPSIGRYF